MKNYDPKIIEEFGDEWSRFDQSKMPECETEKIFEEYFLIFPWESVSANSEGFDMGCGSGRWARRVSPRVGKLHCIDPSDAIEVAKRNLEEFDNITFHRDAVDTHTLAFGSQDFGYSLGVLHHVPNTAAAILSCAKLLKPGAPFLLYLYYAFDNRPLWFKLLWRLSDFARRVIYLLPPVVKQWLTDLIALLVYWPLAKLALLLERLGRSVSTMPLSYYRNHGFYTMRTDARDRFGTSLEKRFTQEQVKNMMVDADLVDIRFSEKPPYWCAVGFKR